MEDFFPYWGFHCARDANNFNNFANTETKIDYVLVVDVNIPKLLHNYFADLPPLLTYEHTRIQEQITNW